MLDLAYVRANLQDVARRLGSRSANLDPLANFETTDAARRQAVTALESFQAERNRNSLRISALRKEAKAAESNGSDTVLQFAQEIEELEARVRLLKQRMDHQQTLEASLTTQLRSLLASLPNLPADDVPSGASEHDNQLIKTWGKPRNFPFPAKPHWELGEALGILDFERAAKISGSRFVVYFGAGARLERALSAFMLDVQTREHGYTEVLPPALVNSRSLFGTGQLPKFADDLFHTDDRGPYIPGQLQDNDRWLIPTAEVPLTNLFRDETIDLSQGSISFTACTPCFRAEAGTYGKDMRGMIRHHQFQKVELVKFTRPEDSPAEHEALTRHAETVLERLDLPYRRVLLCTGDMGFSAAKTYDLEVWLPGQNAYREISSCSNFGDFQARRANIRYKPEGAKKTAFVHTLNGSGLAIGRTYLAVLENYQQPDGTVRVPEALIPYMGGQALITPERFGRPLPACESIP